MKNKIRVSIIIPAVGILFGIATSLNAEAGCTTEVDTTKNPKTTVHNGVTYTKHTCGLNDIPENCKGTIKYAENNSVLYCQDPNNNNYYLCSAGTSYVYYTQSRIYNNRTVKVAAAPLFDVNMKCIMEREISPH